jgi:glycerol-3-phosphate dehydrogenase (NAD(P)+)
MPRKLSNRIVVLGAGNFGTCLAQHLAEKGHSVTIWSNSDDMIKHINEKHQNPKYLSSITLSHRISATNILSSDLLDETMLLLIAVPTQVIREVLTPLKDLVRLDTLVVCASKGIEIGTQYLPGHIIESILGPDHGRNAVILSGPSFAAEVIQRQPTAVCAASKSLAHAQRAQEIFHAAHFRVYTSEDPLGLEVAGALKNVIAIAAGASAGIGYQMNSRAGLITRGLAEITRIGVAMGANTQTFMGLGGVGDLFLSCTSEKSRNYTVGYRLGKGQRLKEIVEDLGSVAEGVTTAKAAYNLSKSLGVSSPITDEIYRILYEDKPMASAVMDLLTRDAKPEF